ncbi:unnamed protein product [marine sediment metagenome]|uniref:Uncharacterized protein n=1 Tax=marine sediment metagenome TaxID=412755 RepID=X1SDP8_9ZZZZ
MDFIIKEKLEEAWEEQDIPKFNSLLDLQKRYEDGEDGALNLFINAENNKRLNEVRQIVEKKIRHDALMSTPISQRIAEVEIFLRREEKKLLNNQ